MLTIIFIVAGAILLVVLALAYSSKNKKAPTLPGARDMTATESAQAADRKRAGGAGDD